MWSLDDIPAVPFRGFTPHLTVTICISAATTADVQNAHI